MLKKTTTKLVLGLLLLFAAQSITAQVTTATLSGLVQDAKGLALDRATVTVEYADAGIKQTLVTNAEGRFVVPNLRVGGPYKITINHVGHNTAVMQNIFLELGANTPLEFKLTDKSVELTEVVVQSGGRIFDGKRTGASTTINNRLIKALPTINRSADDYLRLTPSAAPTANGLSFAGRNGQYNNFSLDGAVFNNPFGLDAPTPGGQTNAQPVSIDAIDQIQVNIAPYDVTQAGFTGAGINSVTKSGGNRTFGTAYAFFRNQDFTGSKVDGTKFEIPSLSQWQIGFSVGGALKQNKLFYFVNFETEQRTEQPTSYVAQNASNAGKSNTARVFESDLIAVSSILRSKFGYETGPYQGFTYNQTNYKWLAKLDWNISDVHKLALTYNGLTASKEKPAHPSAIGRRGPDFTTLQFQNSGYEIVNNLNSFSAELKSNFNNRFANKFRAVFTSFKDKRNPLSSPFPVVNLTKNGVRYIIAGHEPFSIHNRLNQDALQLTNNFNIFLKKHTITVGASYEQYDFANSFNLTGYGPTLFSEADIQTFKDSVPGSRPFVFGAYPLDVDVNYAKNRAAANQWSWYYLVVSQLSFYAQDEINVSKDFTLTVGLRADKPNYFNNSFVSPDFNADGTYKGTFTQGSPTLQNNDNLTLFDANGNRITNGAGKDLDNNRLPTKNILLSPRLGFNWDAKGDKSVQVRGGTGLFTGRFPFVWLGNHIGNPFSFFYNATDRNFQWPQVWRTNLGTDFKIPFGTIFTVDVSYTKDVNAMMVRNYNLGKPSATLQSGTGDTRQIYTNADKGTANAYVFTNTDVGYQFNVSVQAQQTFKNGLYAMVGYNYLTAKDASSISAEISSDAFDRNPILNNANQALLTPSLYGLTHRFIGALSKKFEYADNWGTTISLFGSLNSGDRFAFVYGGDINNDGTSSNDLMYVPTDAEINTMNFAPFSDINGIVQSPGVQRAAFKRFIEQDEYLSSLRGQFTEKYGATNPWYGQLDLRILQDFRFGKEKKQMIQFSFDFINLGNFISSAWGIRKYATTSGYFQPVSVALSGNTPTYRFDPSLTTTFVANPELQSRWQMQFGLRYIF
jgi:hypothetical protein